MQLVAFMLGEQRYALQLSAVDRVIRAVEVTRLPKAPAIVLGMINVQGQIVPVVDLRRRFGLPEREIDVSDQFIIARSLRRRVVLVADAVTGVIELSEQETVAREQILPGLEYVEAIARLESDIILIHDLDTLLSLDEEQVLDQAMRGDSDG